MSRRRISDVHPPRNQATSSTRSDSSSPFSTQARVAAQPRPSTSPPTRPAPSPISTRGRLSTTQRTHPVGLPPTRRSSGWCCLALCRLDVTTRPIGASRGRILQQRCRGISPRARCRSDGALIAAAGADAAALVQKPAYVVHRRPERPPDQAERLPLTSASPDLILVSRRKPVVTHLCLHGNVIIRGWCVDHLRVPRFFDSSPDRQRGGGFDGRSRVPDSRFWKSVRNPLAQWSRVVDHYSHAYRRSSRDVSRHH